MRNVLKLWAIVLLLVPSCRAGGSDLPIGDGIDVGARSGTEIIHPIPVGEEWFLLLAEMRNREDQPLVIRKVGLVGKPGWRDVVSAVEFHIAPDVSQPRAFVTSGLYKSFPPLEQFGTRSRCAVQTLGRVEGFSLGPGHTVRILVRFQTLAVGSFEIEGHEVEYEEDGNLKRQIVPVGISGTVKANGTPVTTTDDQKTCARRGLGTLI